MRHAQIKAFHAVAVWGNFSTAAEKLGLSQPAVSDHIRNLEETYGIQLFVRGQRSTTLTDIGRRLFALTEKMHETETAARDLLSRARGLKQGVMTIGADAAIHVLPILARFSKAYPGVQIKVTGGNTSELMDQLRNFEIDFAVVGEEPSQARFETRLLRRDKFIAFVSKSHPWAKRRSVKFAELADMQLVMRETGSATRALFDEACKSRGIDVMPYVEIEGREAAREAVAAGIGVGIVSRGEHVADNRLHVIDISDWDDEMGEWLVCLKSRTGLHMISALLELADEK